MVYGFAKQSGGAIRIDSKVGEGTRVEIWLPRAPEAEADQLAAKVEDGCDGLSREHPLKILLVDDHAAVRTTTAALLEDLGHKVFEAGDGKEVLDLLGKNPRGYDLLISDYAMPHLSGTDVVHRARQMRPDLPSIIITGYADAQSISRKPDDVLILPKPFTQEQMRASIRAASASSEDQTADARG
jgi:CheY-like chemotaxis protein